ncbi:MAG: hypothetical protein WCH99_05520 [Verrucomicrobiota bacterium]
MAAAIFIFAGPVEGTTFSVTTTNDSGTGSLREAISLANSNPVPNTIDFRITGTPPFTIKLLSALPPVTSPLTIDGTTQSGYSNKPLVELNGAAAGPNAVGLQLNSGADASLLKGLAINRFAVEGVWLISPSNTIQGCFIGTDTTGTNALAGNTNYGIAVFSAGNMIGPSNVVSGNAYAGILISGNAATGNKILGNFIGTDATGKLAVGNNDGIYLTNAIATQIGGTTAGTGNVISGNLRNGIVLMGGSSSNSVQGNLIGVAAGGTNALKNLLDGILISGGSANTIGGIVNGGRNIISGNGIHGVFIGLTNDCFNLIAGNYIGTDITGKTNIPNSLAGVKIQGCTNTVGGGVVKGVSGRNVISGNGQQGIWLSGTNASAAGNIVLGNYIGLDATGTNGLGNGNTGIHIDSSAGNILGPGNTISANATAGIYLSGTGTASNSMTGTTSNSIWGNYIGTDASGTAAPANLQVGIYAESVAANTIGPSNIISGNQKEGVFLTNSAGLSIAGNFIGISASGTAAIANSGGGIVINHANQANLIGGFTAVARNVISGNNICGIYVVGSSSQVIQGNYIGINAAGTAALGNVQYGITLENSTNNLIGGSSSTRNVISGNGIGSLYSGIRILNSPQNTLQGNYIGLNAQGTAAIGNSWHGVAFMNTASNTVGGTTAEARNVISGNGTDGLYFINAPWNLIQGNYIGVAADGVTALGNTTHNVEFESQSTNNILGGLSPGAGNRIAYAKTISPTHYAGVRVRANAFNNLISGNSIFNNDALGIDLGTQGVNPILHLQSGAAATDANRLQNFPTLSNSVSGTATLIRGSFDSATNKTYSLEFFASPTGDASGNGEGQIFLGQTNLTITTISPTNFSVVIPATVAAGWVISATATDPANNTSEFSNWTNNWAVPSLQFGTNPAAGQFKVSWTNSSGNFRLVESTNLNPPVQWTASSLPLTLANGIYSVPVNPTNRQIFFRLLAQ